MKNLVFIIALSVFGLDMGHSGQLKKDAEFIQAPVQDTIRNRVSPQDLPRPVRDSLEAGFTDRNTRVVSAHQLYENGTMIYEVSVVEGEENFIKQYDAQGRKLDEKEGDPDLVRIRVSPQNLPQPILTTIDEHPEDGRAEIITSYQKLKNGKTIYVVNFLENDQEWTKAYDTSGNKLDVETEEIEKAGARKRIDARALPPSVSENIDAPIRFAYQIREGEQVMYEVSYMEDSSLKTSLYDEDGTEIEDS